MMRKLLTKLVACCLVILSGPAAAAQIGAGAGQAQSREASAGDEELARWGVLGRFAGKDLVCQACGPTNITLLRWEVPGKVLRMFSQNEYGTNVTVFRIESEGRRTFDTYWVTIGKDGTLTPQLKARGVTSAAKFNLRWTLEADGSVITYGDAPRSKPVTRFRADGDQLAVDWDRKEGWRFGFTRREIGASDAMAARAAATLRQQARLEPPGATMLAQATNVAPAPQGTARVEGSYTPEPQAFLTPAAMSSAALASAPRLVKDGDSITATIDAANPRTKNGLAYVCYVIDAPSDSAWEIDFKGERPSSIWIARGKACDAVDSWDLDASGSGGFIGTTAWSRARFVSGGGAYFVVARFRDGKEGAYTLDVRKSEGGGRRLKAAPALQQVAHQEVPAASATMVAASDTGAAIAAPASQQVARNEPTLTPAMQAFLTPPAAAAPAKSADPGLDNDRRIALVVGIGNYSNLGALPNPAKDARAIAARLRAVGFDVDLVLDADQRTLKAAIARLGERMSRAGSGATGLFFFAGHGIQSRGINYLIPANAQIAREADVDLEAVAADTVLMQMQEANGSTNIVILDACRNMPLTRSFRSGQRGLAQMDAPNGSFIAYSTAPGSVAADGEGENSPFAAALIQELDRPAQPIEAVFRNVRRSVLRDTEGMQVPWDSSSLIEPFYFIPQ